MASPQASTNDRAVRDSLAVLQTLFSGYQPRDCAVKFWDGRVWPPDPGQEARFTLVLRHPGAVRQMFWPPDQNSLPEAYVYDDFDIEGDAFAFFRLAEHLKDRQLDAQDKMRLVGHLFSLPAAGKPRTGRQPARLEGEVHSPERDRQAISYHYDVSNDFYALWLDSRMVYSCAYFRTPGDDLDTAQENKLDYVCRKLRLRPGQRLLDVGCGWGGLVLHAARNYGVEAVGITLSRRQVEWAERRIREAGLEGRCRVEYRDYREVNEPEGYDRLVSVGMFEHVGEEMLPVYFQQAWQLLRPRGAFLNHGIALPAGGRKPDSSDFGRGYVFPDGDLESVTTTNRAAELTGFEVRDVESLREHYALTLAHWVRRLDARHDEAVRATDEATYRVWRFYMAASASGFRAGEVNIYQTLLCKPERGESGLPLTREDWYGR